MRERERDREMVVGLQYFVERLGEGKGSPLLDDGEELKHVEMGVAVALGGRTPEFPGTLYISTRRVFWLSDFDREKGYAVDFLSLSLHAVSRDPEAYPSPCIYAQIETEAVQNEDSEGSDLECNEDVELSKITELRLIPSDHGQLDTLFNIFCECAELNPEPFEEDEQENQWFTGGEEIADDGDDSNWHFSEELLNSIGHADGHSDLATSVLELQINDERFEDAEDVEQDSHIDCH